MAVSSAGTREGESGYWQKVSNLGSLPFNPTVAFMVLQWRANCDGRQEWGILMVVFTVKNIGSTIQGRCL